MLSCNLANIVQYLSPDTQYNILDAFSHYFEILSGLESLSVFHNRNPSNLDSDLDSLD